MQVRRKSKILPQICLAGKVHDLKIRFVNRSNIDLPKFGFQHALGHSAVGLDRTLVEVNIPPLNPQQEFEAHLDVSLDFSGNYVLHFRQFSFPVGVELVDPKTGTTHHPVRFQFVIKVFSWIELIILFGSIAAILAALFAFLNLLLS